jgi:hypothetical protein
MIPTLKTLLTELSKYLGDVKLLIDMTLQYIKKVENAKRFK